MRTRAWSSNARMQQHTTQHAHDNHTRNPCHVCVGLPAPAPALRAVHSSISRGPMGSDSCAWTCTLHTGADRAQCCACRALPPGRAHTAGKAINQHPVTVTVPASPRAENCTSMQLCRRPHAAAALRHTATAHMADPRKSARRAVRACPEWQSHTGVACIEVQVAFEPQL